MFPKTSKELHRPGIRARGDTQFCLNLNLFNLHDKCCLYEKIETVYKSDRKQEHSLLNVLGCVSTEDVAGNRGSRQRISALTRAKE